MRLIARGALYGARGNSGVILSQALRGLADGADGADVLDAAILARALRQAATTSYAAVTTPVEGTMLSVMRAAAEGAERAASTLARGGAGHGCLSTLRAAIDAAEQAEARTPDQLPALKEAGVPDSGGEGICVLFRGLAASLTGERPIPVVATGRPLAMAGAHAPEEFGFCTEFVIEPIASSLDVAAVKAAVSTPGNRSVLVVGDSTALHVHVHTDDAEALLARTTPDGRQLVVLEALQQAVQYEDAGAWRAGLLDLEARWFAPLQKALASGRMERLRLEASTAYAALTWQCRRGDQWRLWRRPEPLAATAQALARGEA